MKRREFITLLGGAAVAWPLAARAQQDPRLLQITVWMARANDAEGLRHAAALREGLQALSWTNGRNVRIDYRWVTGDIDRVSLAKEIVEQQPALILVESTAGVAALSRASSTIPIVFVNVGDPIGGGFVASLARPGGNVTGNAILYPELSTKRLEILKDVVPGLSHVVVLWNAANPANASVWQATQAAADALGLRLHAQDVRGAQDFAGAFARTAQARPEALLVLDDALINMHRQQIAEFATQEHLPSVFAARESVVAGGLMSYGPSLPDLFRRAATYVDKILKGAKPADLPMEQPMKFELVINLKTAKALGITLPPSLLLLADEVIQ
jgi:putative tryptophan/tyrosine transport system substrate-binding protein